MAMPSSNSGEADQAVQPAGAYAWYVLALLSLTYVLNFIDRQILAMLIEPIKKEFGVSDTAMGLLSGFAFVVFYTIAGIPVARWADRGSRKAIITSALVIWSAMTAACGFARSFAQLAVARVLVGIGEAGGSPPAHSLIADYFPPRQRATALAIYAWGVYVGAALAFLAGGYLIQRYDWRMAFIIVGLPGIVLAILFGLTVKEPPRGWSEGRSAATTPPLGETLRHLATRRAFILIALASAVQSLSGYGVLTWGPTFLARVHAMSWNDIGVSLGSIIGVAGCLGTFVGGRMADRFGARDVRWYMRLPAIQSLLCVPFVAGFALMPTPELSLLSFVPFYALGAMYLGPMFAVVQGLAPLRMRTLASAILLFVVNMVGLGLGPLAIGLLNDHVFAAHGAEAIRYSMLTMGIAGGGASLLFWRSSVVLGSELRQPR